MNLCFLIGKIISDIEFEFVLNSRDISIVRFKIELTNKSVIRAKAYNEMADWCYQNLIKNNAVTIYGEIDNKMEIIISEIECMELSS